MEIIFSISQVRIILMELASCFLNIERNLSLGKGVLLFSNEIPHLDILTKYLFKSFKIVLATDFSILKIQAVMI
jgi:hypothetical protein